MQTNKSSLFPWKTGAIPLIVAISILLTASCGTGNKPTTTPALTSREEFTTRSESENGAIISWGGFKEGYEAGGEAVFDLTIDNQTDQEWKGQLCLVLLDQGSPSVLASLEKRPFTLSQGMGFSDILEVRLPKNLEPGAYGLSLVVYRPAGPTVDMVSIEIGSGNEERLTTSQADMDAALEACPPEEETDVLTGMAVHDLAQRLEIKPENIEVRSVEAVEFPDASLGVPGEGQMYAQVITPGYVIILSADGETYRYHGADRRVVFVPEGEGTLPPGAGEKPGGKAAFEIPAEGSRVVLPLHILARTGQPQEDVTVLLRWEDGTELSASFSTLGNPHGGSILIGSLDWQNEGQPPQPPTQPASLVIQNAEGEILVQTLVTVLNPDDPRTTTIDLFWTLGEKLGSEQRRVLITETIEKTALEELLWGPPPRNMAGFRTAIPTPEEVLAYPGREADWGPRVEILGLTIEDGTATVNFSREMNAYGGGSMRVQTIREQITQTLLQFPSVDEVIIAIEGQTEGVLQP